MAEADVVALSPADDSPEAVRRDVNTGLVEMFEKLLVRAKAGELQGALVALVVGDGDIAQMWTRTTDVPRLVAAATLAHAAYCKHVVEDLATPTTVEGG